MDEYRICVYREIAGIAIREGIIHSAPAEDDDLLSLIDQLFQHGCVAAQELCDDIPALLV